MKLDPTRLDLFATRHKGVVDALYQVEKSHVPFADDPPIVYPDAEWWQQMTNRRKDRYSSMDLSIKGTAEKKIEDALIDAQSPDSDFGKARDAFRPALKSYQEAQKLAGGDKPEIADVKRTYESAKETYDPLRKKLLEGDSDWVAANADLMAKQKALDELNKEYTAALGKLTEAEAHAANTAATTPNQPPQSNQGGKGSKGGKKK